MLKFHVVDTEPVSDHLWSIQNIKRPRWVVRMRGILQNAIETQRHHREAV
jgi:hypothetical protein